MADVFEQDFPYLNWRQNYQFKSESGWASTADRVSSGIAAAEDDSYREKRFSQQLYELIKSRRWLPGGRVLANVGTTYGKATAINCFVSGPQTPDVDSIEEINAEIGRCMKILASEGGYGVNANWLRPRGALIRGTGARTPGAVEMLNLWDQTAQTLTKGPEQEAEREEAKEKIRKGAMMVTMSLWHPDVMEFIEAKAQAGRLTNFNMSVLASDDFMEAVQRGDEWNLVYPDFENQSEAYKQIWDGNLDKWMDAGGDVVVYDTVDARDLWNKVMRGTYENNEPGVQFIDTINRRNPLYYTEYILGSNPCGEQMLPPGGSCNLGNFVLPRYAEPTIGGSYKFDFEAFKRDIPKAVRALDNVNDVSAFPLEEQAEQAQTKRRIGLGHMGFGSLCLMMKIPYGSQESVLMARRIQNTLMNEAYAASAELAREKGQFALYDEEKYMEGDMVERLSKDTQRKISAHGLRNSHLLSIQPTGNTSQVAGVVSGGLEPVFSFKQQRTAEQPHLPDELEKPSYMPSEEGEFYEYAEDYVDTTWVAEKQHREIVWRCTEEGYEDWTIHPTRGICKDVVLEDYGVRRMKEIGEWDPDAEWAVKTLDLTVKDHISVMEEFARYTDSALSKTVNVPADYSFEEFKNLYEDAWETGVIKGLTTYRAGTMSAVLEDADEDDEEDVNSEDEETCPRCGSTDFIHTEGCKECDDCGYEVCEL